MKSKLDRAYRRIISTKFFTKGWGSPEKIKKLLELKKIVSDRKKCFATVSDNTHFHITHEYKSGTVRIINGQFHSPFAALCPDLVPEVAQTAYFQMILPLNWTAVYRPLVIQLAGTGDHHFYRRREFMAKPLIEESGIASILLENPFYGARKPIDQVRSSLHHVSDIFVMGGCLIMECLALLKWCESQGFGPLGITGISMGGHMASLAATVWPKPLVLVPCLSWTTASTVFTEGVMSESIDWNLLKKQYKSNSILHSEITNMINVDDKEFTDVRFMPDHEYNDVKIVSKSDSFTSDKFSVDIMNISHIFDKFAAEEKFISNPKEPGLDSTLTQTINLSVNKNSNEHYQADKETKNNQITQEYYFMNILSLINIVEEALNTFIKTAERRDAKLFNIDILPMQWQIKFNLKNENLNNSDFDDYTRKNNFLRDYALFLKEQLIFIKTEADSLLVNINTSKNVHSNELFHKRTMQFKNKILLLRKKAAELETSIDRVSKKYIENTLLDTYPLSIAFGYVTTNKIFNSIFSSLMKPQERDQEVMRFMRAILDEFTHLNNFPVPFDQNLIIAVTATDDAYVPREDVLPLHEVWPEIEVRFVETGHVGAYLWYNQLFRKSIRECFDRAAKLKNYGK